MKITTGRDHAPQGDAVKLEDLTDEQLRQLRDEAFTMLRDVDAALTKPGRLVDTPDGDRIIRESIAARRRICSIIGARTSKAVR